MQPEDADRFLAETYSALCNSADAQVLPHGRAEPLMVTAEDTLQSTHGNMPRLTQILAEIQWAQEVIEDYRSQEIAEINPWAEFRRGAPQGPADSRAWRSTVTNAAMPVDEEDDPWSVVPGVVSAQGPAPSAAPHVGSAQSPPPPQVQVPPQAATQVRSPPQYKAVPAHLAAQMGPPPSQVQATTQSPASAAQSSAPAAQSPAAQNPDTSVTPANRRAVQRSMECVTEGDNTGTTQLMNENKQRYQMWFAIMDDPRGWGAAIHWEGVAQRLNQIKDPKKLCSPPSVDSWLLAQWQSALGMVHCPCHHRVPEVDLG